MFFSPKKLIARKKKYQDQIQLAYNQMNNTHMSLMKSLNDFYSGFVCFDEIEFTTVDFWLSDVACSYEGQNDDLSEALFGMSDKLSGIEAETLNTQQIIDLYNLFIILVNDLFCTEEQILSKTDVSKQLILEKFKELINKLALLLKTDQSASSIKLCTAVEKFYTFLDFSLSDSRPQYYLRQLRKQYLIIQSTSYETIDHCEIEIEIIDKELEEHNYSADGKRISKKEYSPFATLKAYNNAMALFVHCMEAVEKYEHDGKLLSPSCTNDIKKEIFSQLIESKDEFDEWDSSVNFEKVAHTILAHTTFDMLASGRYHLYAGILNPMNCSANLMLIYDKAMDYGVKIGMVTKDEQAQQRAYLLECISEVG